MTKTTSLPDARLLCSAKDYNGLYELVQQQRLEIQNLRNDRKVKRNSRNDWKYKTLALREEVKAMKAGAFELKVLKGRLERKERTIRELREKLQAALRQKVPGKNLG